MTAMVGAQSMIESGARRCSRCKQQTADFSPTSSYCRPCQKARYREKLEPTVVVPLVKVTIEDQLALVMVAYMTLHGFTKLHTTTERLKNDLARANRKALAQQGWIA